MRCWYGSICYCSISNYRITDHLQCSSKTCSYDYIGTENGIFNNELKLVSVSPANNICRLCVHIILALFPLFVHIRTETGLEIESVPHELVRHQKELALAMFFAERPRSKRLACCWLTKTPHVEQLRDGRVDEVSQTHGVFDGQGKRFPLSHLIFDTCMKY